MIAREHENHFIGEALKRRALRDSAFRESMPEVQRNYFNSLAAERASTPRSSGYEYREPTPRAPSSGRKKSKAQLRKERSERARNRPRDASGQWITEAEAERIAAANRVRRGDYEVDIDRVTSPNRSSSRSRSRSSSPLRFQNLRGTNTRALRARDFIEEVQEASGSPSRAGTEPSSGITIGSQDTPQFYYSPSLVGEHIPWHTPSPPLHRSLSPIPARSRSRSRSRSPARGPMDITPIEEQEAEIQRRNRPNPFVIRDNPVQERNNSPGPIPGPQYPGPPRRRGRGAQAVVVARHVALPLHVNETLRYAHRKVFKARKYGAPPRMVEKMVQAKTAMENAIATWLHTNWNSRR